MNMEESTNGSLAAEFRHLVGDFFLLLTHPFDCVGREGDKLPLKLLFTFIQKEL